MNPLKVSQYNRLVNMGCKDIADKVNEIVRTLNGHRYPKLDTEHDIETLVNSYIDVDIHGNEFIGERDIRAMKDEIVVLLNK